MTSQTGPRATATVVATCLLAVAALTVAVLSRPGRGPLAVDSAWFDLVKGWRGPLLDGPAHALDVVGAGVVGVVVLPLAVATLLWLRRGPRAALALVVASLLDVVVVQALKRSVARPRPADMLVTSDFGSFPSGHTAHAAVLSVLVALALGRGWAWAAGGLWTTAMMVSRTYLGAHWLTDTVAGAAVGIAVGLAVWHCLVTRTRLSTTTLDGEHERPD